MCLLHPSVATAACGGLGALWATQWLGASRRAGEAPVQSGWGCPGATGSGQLDPVGPHWTHGADPDGGRRENRAPAWRGRHPRSFPALLPLCLLRPRPRAQARPACRPPARTPGPAVSSAPNLLPRPLLPFLTHAAGSWLKPERARLAEEKVQSPQKSPAQGQADA